VIAHLALRREGEALLRHRRGSDDLRSAAAEAMVHARATSANRDWRLLHAIHFASRRQWHRSSHANRVRPPDSGWNRFAGALLGHSYARWCVDKMVEDASARA
jgi:hypothetical protein